MIPVGKWYHEREDEVETKGHIVIVYEVWVNSNDMTLVSKNRDHYFLFSCKL